MAWTKKGKRAEAEWQRMRQTARSLDKQLKDATLSSFPPHEREAAWERLKAREAGLSVQAYRSQQARRKR